MLELFAEGSRGYLSSFVGVIELNSRTRIDSHRYGREAHPGDAGPSRELSRTELIDVNAALYRRVASLERRLSGQPKQTISNSDDDDDSGDLSVEGEPPELLGTDLWVQEHSPPTDNVSDDSVSYTPPAIDTR